MNRLASTALIFALFTQSLEAQSGGLLRHIEVGGTASVGANLGGGSQRETVTPWSVRLAYVSPGQPWGVEFATEMNGRRSSSDAGFSEFAVPVSVVRRIGPGMGPQRTSGVYASVGLSARSTALSSASPATRTFGTVYALGTRVTVGRALVLRPEYVVMKDNGGTMVDGTAIPGVYRSTFRFGVATYFPTAW